MVVILIVGGESPNPPSTTVSIHSQVSASPDATTKEEEWVKKKKVEVVTKRQIATRVQREVLLKDGKVVQDSGPKVTTTTTEDTEKQESQNTEHHDVGDGPDEGWIPVGDPQVQTEVREKKVTTREEKNETTETEDIKHLGDISDEAYRRAVESGTVEESLVASPGTQLAERGPRVVSHSSRTHRVTDTEDTLKTSQVDPQGKLIVNTSTTREHEEVNEEQVPDAEGESEEDIKKEKSHHFTKIKDQGFVDYLVDGTKVGTEMRYDAETTDATRLGEEDWDSLSARLRKMRRGRLLKDSEEERKELLAKKPLDFHQEERTRKLETSKWLEQHFGSESASRSSRDSEDEGPHTSFINVTMKSAKSPEPTKPVAQGKVFVSSPDPERSYFKGVSEWKSEERRFTRSPKIEGVQVLPTGPNHTFHHAGSSPSPPYSRQKSPSPLHNGTKSPSPPYARSKSPSPPYTTVNKKFPSTQHLERKSPSTHSQQQQSERFTKTSKYYSHERTTSPFGRNSPMYNGHSPSPVNGKANGKISPPRGSTPTSISPPPRRRAQRKLEREEEVQEEEPAPDYSPTPEPKSPHHTPPPSDTKKKVYQRTRFAADIPPAARGGKGDGGGKRRGVSGGLGESFRRLVGRLVGGGGGKKGASKEEVSGGRVVDSTTQTPAGPPPAEMHARFSPAAPHPSHLNRFYLGEDPFSDSIYGRESEYDGVQVKRRHHRRSDDDHSNSRHQSTSTLGRLSKSTSKLSGSEKPVQNGTTIYYTDRGGVQTLPRKLQEHKTKRQVYVTRSNGEAPHTYSDHHRLGNNSSSMFNVSIVNNVSPTSNHVSNGPVKPARTYKTNLLRSKSFNVHGGDLGRDGGRYTSNPHLHRLDESHEPLKSPGIVTSISRSTRDLTHQDSDDGYTRRPLGTYDQNRYVKHNGYNSRSTVDAKKKIFMKGLMDRAPELYKTLHGNDSEESKGSPEPVRTSTPLKNGKLEYSTSFRSSNTSSPLERVTSPVYSSNLAAYRRGGSPEVNKSIVRRGSNDYTETVSYTTKSDNPHRPSVTNTVQSFTKKTVPMPGGRKETIESSETKTITKSSRFRSGTPDLHLDNKYTTSNGGVVIEVRNTRK